MDKKMLGDYELIKQIGQGTLGSAYLAKHRFVKKLFVVKVFPEELATDRNFIQRFEREIGGLALLEHPRLVKTYNVSFAEGYYFLVTDAIADEAGETKNLMRYLSSRKQELEEKEITHLLLQVAEGLSYLHQQRVGGLCGAHRGLKLSNVLIEEGSQGVCVYLSDTGLSSIVGEAVILTRMYHILSRTLTPTVSTEKLGSSYLVGDLSDKIPRLHASFLHSFTFLAPEQKIYRKSPIGPQSDVYAFGVLAYFLFMRMFPEGIFPLPSEKYSDLRSDWDRLILSCMQLDPSKRPTNLLEFYTEVVGSSVATSSSQNWDGVQSWGEGGSGSRSFSQEDRSEPSFTIALSAESQSEREEATRPSDSSRVETNMLSQLSQAIRHSQSSSSFRAKPILKPREIRRPEYDPDPAAAFHVDSQVSRYIPQKKGIKNAQPLHTDMVVIPGGKFKRGSHHGARDEQPEHEVTLKSFAIDIHPVTNEQFLRFLEVMGGEKDGNDRDMICLRESRIRKKSGRFVVEPGYNDHPVTGVTWDGSIAYAKWVGKRLPTEAEWEIAAKGGGNEAYPTGISIEKSQANFFSADTTAVRSYPPNGYQLYGMAGNVYEWCQDWYVFDYYDTSKQEPEDPQGPFQGVYRVLRGGCWKSLKEDLRCSHRHRNNPGTANSTYGFRCATDVLEQSQREGSAAD